MPDFVLHQGDCLDVLRGMADNSVDSIVTDPPYGLAFMGKRWDYDVPSAEVWAECLRVLKPGGHLLAFAGTRTQHRMAVRIEDAGFEIRDMIAWVYGSGFPKSLDVSKAIDKVNGEAGRLHKFTAWMRTTGLTAAQINAATGTFMGSHYLTDKSQPAIPTRELWAKLRPLCGDVPAWVDALVDRIAADREVVGVKVGNDTSHSRPACAVAAQGVEATRRRAIAITAPATEAARQWEGWGTALKPALEPITVARKPLVGTVAENVLQYGTGALNIDGCRVAGEPVPVFDTVGGRKFEQTHTQPERRTKQVGTSTAGRWPANLIHDGSDEVVACFPREAGASAPVRGTEASMAVDSGAIYGRRNRVAGAFHADTDSAARFFYCAKASKRDRDEGLDRLSGPQRNVHPTVKPTDLMRYLCRLVTPPGGVVLDPFMGSGSTGKAAMLEGFRFIGIEREQEYVEIARARIAAAMPVGLFAA